jgi:hypothetical protein
LSHCYGLHHKYVWKKSAWFLLTLSASHWSRESFIPTEKINTISPSSSRPFHGNRTISFHRNRTNNRKPIRLFLGFVWFAKVE